MRKEESWRGFATDWTLPPPNVRSNTSTNISSASHVWNNVFSNSTAANSPASPMHIWNSNNAPAHHQPSVNSTTSTTTSPWNQQSSRSSETSKSLLPSISTITPLPHQSTTTRRDTVHPSPLIPPAEEEQDDSPQSSPSSPLPNENKKRKHEEVRRGSKSNIVDLINNPKKKQKTKHYDFTFIPSSTSTGTVPTPQPGNSALAMKRLENELKAEREKVTTLESQLSEEQSLNYKLKKENAILADKNSVLSAENKRFNGDELSELTLREVEDLLLKLKASEQKVIDELIRRCEQYKRKEEDNASCVICMENKRTQICLPCGHLNMCDSCCTKLTDNKCPQCRAIVKDFCKFFTN